MPANQHVLYITYDGLTDPLGTSQILPYLKGLAREGYTITVLSAEKKSRYNAYAPTIREALSASGLHWECINYHKFPPALSTFWDLYRLYRKAKKIVQQHPIQVVHCRSQLATLIGLRLKHRYPLRLIFDMRGFFADERVEGGLWNLKNPVYKGIYRYFKRKESEFFTQSDSVICLTEKARSIIRDQQNPHVPPIQVIPCMVDTELFAPRQISSQKRQQMREQLHLSPEEGVLTYLGSVGTWYLLEEMLLFYQQMRKAYPKTRFLFICANQQQEIWKKVRKLGISPRHIIVTQAFYPEIPALLSLSTLSIFFIKPTFSKQASSPTKQAELLSMGVPVITNPGVGDTPEIFQKIQGGALVNEFTKQEYQRVVKEEVPELLNLSPDKIREGALQHLSLQDGIQRYARVYQTLMTESS